MEDKIAYFELLKDLPGCPAGSSFTVVDNEATEPYIFCGDIRFPVWYTVEYLDWFRAVYMKEYQANFKKSFFYYAMTEMKCDEAGAQRAWENFKNN